MRAACGEKRVPYHRIVACAGCDEELVEGSGYQSGGYDSEEFHDEDCYVKTMETRAERAHDRGF